jgi:hypothetical protein
MDEKTKSIWKKSWLWKGWRGYFLLSMVFSAVPFFTILLAGLAMRAKDPALPLATFFALTGFFIVSLVSFIRWVFCWRNFKRFLFGLACFATLIALFYAEEDWRGKHDWEKFKREWEAKGEKFDYASVIPPPVPDDQNFAMAPIWVESMKAVLGPKNSRQWFGDNFFENGRTNFSDRLAIVVSGNEDLVSSPPQTSDGYWAKGTLFNLKLWQDYYRTLAAKTNEFPIAPQPQTPAQDVLLALSKYDSTVEELRQASLLPYSRFPVYSDADHPFDTLLPHLAELKRCTQDLKLRAIAELQNGQSEKALADVKLMVRLADAIRTEPFLISHLVRIAIFSLTLQPIYEGLAEHKWSDAQLTDLDSELWKLDFLGDYEHSIRGERAAAVSALDYMRRTRDTTGIQGGDERHHPFNIGSLMPGAFFYQNELTIAQMYQQYDLPMVDLEKETVSPIQVHNLQTKADRDMNHHWWPYKIFARMLFPAVENAVKKMAYAQSATDLARVAIALERFRLAHGEFPGSLDALVPQFLEKIPHDIINGEPLHYRRTDDPPSQSSGAASGQFVLYSVGWNETDDGGVVVFGKGETPGVDTSKGDWVWRYPKAE